MSAQTWRKKKSKIMAISIAFIVHDLLKGVNITMTQYSI